MNSTTDFKSSGFLPSGGLCMLGDVAGIYVYTAALILLAIVSVVENILVIVAICKYDALRTPSIILLGVLAVIDLVTGSVVTPFKIWLTLMDARQSILTFLWMFTSVVLFSLATVLMISFDRLFHVCFLEKYKLTKKKLILGLSVCWIIPFVVLILLASRYYGIPVFILALVCFVFCILGMVVAYIIIMITLAKHRSRFNDVMRQNYIEEQRNAVKTSLLISATCVAMNLPPLLGIALAFAGIFSKALCATTFFTLLANSAINPVIYFLRIPAMRKYIFMLLRINKFTEGTAESDDAFVTVLEDKSIDMKTSTETA